MKRKPEQERHLGKNVFARVKNGHILIRVNLTKNYGASKSGRSEIVATTRGTVRVPGSESMKYGLNVFTVNPKDAAEGSDTIELAA